VGGVSPYIIACSPLKKNNHSLTNSEQKKKEAKSNSLIFKMFWPFHLLELITFTRSVFYHFFPPFFYL
jgi:hypothetical protein